MDGNITKNNEFTELKGTIVKIPEVDETLTKEGYAADAKKTGEALANLQSQIDALSNK
jgi:hypothetical protein